jgi:hypothetical protein
MRAELVAPEFAAPEFAAPEFAAPEFAARDAKRSAASVVKPSVRSIPAGPASAPHARLRARTGWFIGPVLLFAVGAGIRFVMRGPDEIFGLCFAVLLGLGVLWILVSALLPARADRTCPQCGRDSLERLDPDSTKGVSCARCGWRDETASSFLMAEEEGPLEDIVLRERRARGEHRRW